MSDSAALIERMSTAVRTAYKAIEVLKEENKALKAENDALRSEISKLRSGSTQDDYHIDIAEGSVCQSVPPKVHVSDPLGQSFQLKAPPRKDVAQPVTNQYKPQPALLLAVPADVPLRPTTTDVIICPRAGSVDIEEHGLVKPHCNLKFISSPDSKRIFAVLAELSEFNVHAVARAISEISMETVSKALMNTITSYFSMEVLTSWGNLLGSVSCSGHLLPKAVLVRLDLLCTFLVSIGSRATNGLIRVSKLVTIVKKVIMGSIRCQLESPHYALAVGTLRSRRVSTSQPVLQHQDDDLEKTGSGSNKLEDDAVKTEGGNAENELGDGEGEGESASDSEDEDSRGHFGVPEDALSDSDSEEEDGAEEHKPAARPSLAAWGQARRGSEGEAGAASAEGAVVPRSEQKAALSSMFGLDSSDDEAEDGDEEEDRGMTNDNDVSYTYDNDADDMEIANDNDFVSDQKSTAVAESVAAVVAVVTHAPYSAKGSDTLEHASKLYFLLSALVRLRQVYELVSALRELRLVTAGNVSAGAVIGAIAVLGSRRFRALTLPGVASEVKELLVQWHADLLSMNVRNEANTASPEEPVGLPTAKLLIELIDKFWAALEPALPLPTLLLPTDLSTQTSALQAHIAQETWNAPQLARDFRRLGFWGSLVAMGGSCDSMPDNAFAAGVQGPLGLDKLPGHALMVQEIVGCWDPAATHVASQDNKHMRGALQQAPSLKDFVNSDAYLFSTLQCVVQQTVKSARIQQTKLVAEELLVEELALHWKDNISSAEFQAHAARKSIQVMHELLHNFISTDYDASEGGWRCGAGGEGFRLSSRLDNRLTVGLALLKKLAECGGSSEHFVGSSAMLALKPSLQWLHYSSLSGRKLLEYAEFVDHCASEVFHGGAPSNGSVGLTPTELMRHITEGKLHAVCCEIVTLLAFASMEALVFAFVCSLRALLLAVRKEKDGSGNDGLTSLVEAAIGALTALPSPWAGIARADIQQEILATHRCMGGWKTTDSVPCCGKKQDWMTQLASSQPVFVINLDKRADRLRRLLITLEQAELSAVKVRAFDGTSGDATSSLTPAEMFQRNFAADTADSALPAPRATPRLEDAYSSIPESDVQLTWDSTLNNKFDPRCPVNTRTVATQSERACAASHLRVWRAIAAARGTRAAKSKLRGVQSLAAESSDALAERFFASADDIYKSLTSVSLGKSRPPLVKSSAATPAAETAASLNQVALVEDSFCQEGTDYFIIFEDDVSFPQQSLVDLRATIRSIMRVLPASVDILYLCGVLPKACADFKLKNIKGDPFFSINYAWTLQAYVLRSRAVEVLLSKLPIFAPVDNFVASLVYHGELRACIVKDKLTQRLTGPVTAGGGRKNDSDVRPSGRSYSGLPKRPLTAPGADSNTEGSKKRKVDRRKRRKH